MDGTPPKISSPLQGGQQCVKRIATATSLLRTQIQRWRKDPSQAEEIAEEVELKSVADIQNEIDKAVTSSKLLENEFQADTEGENYRNAIANTGLRMLQVHVVTSMLTVHEQVTYCYTVHELCTVVAQTDLYLLLLTVADV